MPEAGGANIEIAHQLNETEKHRKIETPRKTEILEIFEAVVLALVAVSTAWSGYQAARWDGQQSLLYGHSSKLRIEAQGMEVRGNQIQMYDALTVTEWLKAEAHGDTKLAELFEKAFFTGGGAGQKPLPLGIRPGRADLRADAVELVLFLKFVDLALQALLRKTECVDQLLQFGDAANHFRTVDDQFADGVHHAVEPRERDAHGLDVRSRFGGRGGGRFGRGLFRFRRRGC